MSWIKTVSGKRIDYFDPDPASIDIEDIAHALAMQPHFTGHIVRFFSIAEHCVLLSRLVAEEDARWALLHDAAEAYTGDMPGPLKRLLDEEFNHMNKSYQEDTQRTGLNYARSVWHTPPFRAVTHTLDMAIERRFDLWGGLAGPVIKSIEGRVKEADNRLILTEHIHLRGPGEDLNEWKGLFGEPFDIELPCWPWETAKNKFIERFHQLFPHV